jgi:hypothetical protein
MLMRAAEREMNEIERKKQAVEALSIANSRPKDATEINKTKLESLLKEIKAESLRLTQARLQLQALKATQKPKSDGSKTATTVGAKDKDVPTGIATSSTTVNGKPGKKPGPAKSKVSTTTTDGSVIAPTSVIPVRSQPKLGGPKAFPIPNSVLPELCK